MDKKRKKIVRSIREQSSTLSIAADSVASGTDAYHAMSLLHTCVGNLTIALFELGQLSEKEN